MEFVQFVCRGLEEETALHLAASCGCIELITLLLKHGAFVDTEVRFIDTEVRYIDTEVSYIDTEVRYIDTKVRFVDTEVRC